MKILIENYTFDKDAKTVTFDDYSAIELDNVILITNVTSNTIIYQFNKASKGGSVAGNVLTLTFDTTSMADTDDLQIFYDDPKASQRDTYYSDDAVNDLAGADAVETVNFSRVVDLIWIRSIGGVSRAGVTFTPTATKGAYCADDEPTPITIRTDTIDIYIPSGATVSVWADGYDNA